MHQCQRPFCIMVGLPLPHPRGVVEVAHDWAHGGSSQMPWAGRCRVDGKQGRGVGWNQMACQAPKYVATSYKEGSLGTQPASNPPTFQSLFPPTVPPTTIPASPGFLKDPSCRLAPAQVSPFLPPKSACLAPSPALRPPSGPSLSIPGQCPLTSPFCHPGLQPFIAARLSYPRGQPR